MKNCPQCSATYPDEYVVCPKDGSRLTSGSPWEVNSVIRGKYRILSKIGQGGMATVYRAHHELLDEPRALKVINPELARDELFVKRFKNEAINTRKLQHPNAVRVDDLDIAEDGRPFIAMEMVGGECLKDLIKRSGPMPCTTVVEIASQLCEALGAAHVLGITHRDIKPDNIVLLRGSDMKLQVKILDFGIASLKETAGAGSNTLTGTGVVIGTPDYMSPEQAMGKRGEDIDGRSDIYSLGIVIYHMLTGELPFKANTTVEMILHHVQDVPPPPQKLKPNLAIPESVSDIVMKALEKDRAKRFATAPSMGTALRLAVASAAARPVPITPPAAVATVKTGAAPDDMPQTRVVPKPLPEPRPAAASPVPAKCAAPAPRPPAPAGRPAVPTKKFPVYRVGVGIVVVVVVGLGAWRFMQRPAPVPAPPVTVPKSAPEVSAPPKPAPPKSAATKSPESTAPSSPQGEIRPHRSEPSPEHHPEAQPSVIPAEKAATERVAVKQPGTTAGRTPAETGSEKPRSADNPSSGETTREPQSPTTSGPSPETRPNRPQTEGERAADVIRKDMQPEIRPMNDRATELFKKGMYMRAAQIYQRVLDIAPNNQRAQIGLKKCQEKIKAMRQRNYDDEP